MNKPITRILLGVAALFLSLEAFSLIKWGHISGISFLALIGAVIGPVMAIGYPFSIAFKIGYCSALVASLGFIIIGFNKRNGVLGQIITVIGIAGWVICGLLGLGTGT